jgi:hypothetical protein
LLINQTDVVEKTKNAVLGAQLKKKSLEKRRDRGIPARLGNIFCYVVAENHMCLDYKSFKQNRSIFYFIA